MLQGDQAAPSQFLKVLYSLEIPHKWSHVRIFTLTYMTSLLSIMVLRLVHVVVCIQFLAVAEKYSTVWTYHFLHEPVNEHLFLVSEYCD